MYESQWPSWCSNIHVPHCSFFSIACQILKNSQFLPLVNSTPVTETHHVPQYWIHTESQVTTSHQVQTALPQSLVSWGRRPLCSEPKQLTYRPKSGLRQPFPAQHTHTAILPLHVETYIKTSVQEGSQKPIGVMHTKGARRLTGPQRP